MSKMNNNSRKNSKTTKNTTKKTTRSRTSSKKNFKIENLEPRLMMDAATGFDINRIDEYKNQFADVADSIANNVSSAVAAVTEFDVSILGIAQNAADFVSMLGDTADQFKTEIVNKVKDVLQNAIVTAKSEIEAFNNTVSDINDKITQLDFSEFVNNYVQSELASLKDTTYKGLSFAAEGSKLIVTIDHANEKSLSGMGFSFGSLGDIKMDGNSALSTAAKIQMSVDFNSDNDEYYFEDINDVSISGLDVQKLEARIQNLGLHATFMNMGLAEQDVTNEQTPDLSMSYDGSDVSTTVDLEFTLENSVGLPFSFANGEYLKISNSTGELKVVVPDFQIKDNFSLETLLANLDFTDLPYLNQLKMNFGGRKISIAEVVQNLNDTWARTSMALSAAISKVQSSAAQAQQQFVLDVQTLQQRLEAIAGEKWNELNGYLDRLEVCGYAIVDAANSAVNGAINLVEGENTITLSFKPKISSLDDLNLFSFNLGNLNADFSFALKLSITVGADGSVSFGVPSFEQFNLGVKGIQLPSGLPITLDGDELSVSLQGGDFVATLPEIELVNNFSLETVLDGIGNLDIPFLEKTLFTVGGTSYGALDVVKKVNAYWGILSSAMYNSVIESNAITGKFMLGLEQLKNHLYDVIGQKKAELDNFIKNIEVVKTNLINTVDEKIKVFDSAVVDAGEFIGDLTDKYIDLISGDNAITVFFTPKTLGLETLDLNVFNLDGLDVETPIALDVIVTLENGNISFKSISVRDFDIHVTKNADLNFSVLGFDAEVENGSFDLSLSFGNKFDITDAKLGFEQLTFKKNGFVLLNRKNDFVAYDGNEWKFPDVLPNISSIVNGDNFDVNTLISIAKTSPYISSLKFSVPVLGEVSVQDVLNKVYEVRMGLPSAIAQTMQAVNDATDILFNVDAQALRTAFMDVVGSKIEGWIDSVDLKLADIANSEFVDILDASVVSTFGLKKGVNTFNMVFKPLQTTLDNLSVAGVDLPNVQMGAEIGMSFSFELDESGKISNVDISFDSFQFAAKPSSNPFPSVIAFGDDGFVVRYDGSEWKFEGVKIKVPEFSFETVTTALSKLPYLQELNIKISDDISFNVSELLGNAGSLWDSLGEALQHAVDVKNSTVGSIELATKKLQQSFNNLIQDKDAEVKSWLESLKIATGVFTQLEDAADSWIDILNDEGAALETLTGSMDFTIVFAPKKATLKNLSVYGVSAGDLDLDASIALKVSIAVQDGFVKLAVEPAFVSLNASVKNLPRELPFSIEEGKNTVQISWNGKDGWNLRTPELKWKSNFSLETILNGLQNANFPFMDKLSFKIGEETYNVVKIAQNINNYWSMFSGAFYQAVDQTTTNAEGKYNVLLSDIASNLMAALEQQEGVVGDFVKKIGVFKTELYDTIEKTDAEFANIFSAKVQSDVPGPQLALGTQNALNELVNQSIELVEGSNKITVAFTPKQLGLDKLDLGLFNLGMVDFDATIALDLTLNVKNGKVTFAGVALREFALKVEKDFGTEFNFMGQTANVEKGKISFDVSVSGRKFNLKKCDIEFSFDKFDIKRGSASLVSIENGKFAYMNGEWVYPDEINKLISILKNGEFSLSDILAAAKAFNIPVLNTTAFKIGNYNYSIAEIAEKVDSTWDNLSVAMQKSVKQVADDFQIDLDTLYSLLKEYTGKDYDQVKSLISRISVLKDAVGTISDDVLNAHDVLKSCSEKIGLDVGHNTVSFVLDTASFNEKLKIYSVNIDNFAGSFKVQIDVSFDITEDGMIKNFKTSLQELVLDIDLSNYSLLEALPIKVDDTDNHLRIGFNKDLGWEKPDFQFTEIDSTFFANLINQALPNIPYIKDLGLTIAGHTYSIDEVFSNVLNVWKNTSNAIQTAINWKDNAIKLDVKQFKTLLEEYCKDEKSTMSGWLSKVRVAAGQYESLYKTLSNAYEVWANADITDSTVLSGGEFTFVYSMQPAYINDLKLYSIPLGSLALSLDVAVKVQVTGSGTNLKFNPSIAEVAFNIDVSSSVVDNLPITFDSKNIRISYSNGSWNAELPDFHLKNENLSIENLIAAAANLPMLKDWKFTVAGETISVADVITKVNDAWSGVYMAICGAKEQGVSELSYELVRQGLRKLLGDDDAQINKFKEYVGDIQIKVLNTITDQLGASVDVISYVSILDKTSLTDKLTLSDQAQNITLAFKPSLAFADKVKFGPLDIGQVKMDADIEINVSVLLKNGELEINKITLDKFGINLANTAGPLNTELFGLQTNIDGLSLSGGVNIDPANTNPLNGKISIGYNSISLGSFSFGKGEFGYDFTENKLTYPNGLDDVFNADLSLSTILSFAEKMNIPYIGEKIPIAGTSGLSVIDIAKKIDFVRANFSMALKNFVTKANAGQIAAQLDDLFTEFQNNLGTDYGTIFSLFDTAKAKIDGLTIDFKNAKLLDSNLADITDFAKDGLLAISGSRTITFDFGLSSSLLSIFGFSCTPKVDVSFGIGYNCGDGTFTFDAENEFKFVITAQGITSDNTKGAMFPFCVEYDNKGNSQNFAIEVKHDLNGWNFVPNVTPNSAFSATGLIDGLKNISIKQLLGYIKDFKLPFVNKSLNDVKFNIDNVEYTIPSAVETVSTYWDMVSNALSNSCSIEGDATKIAKIDINSVATLLQTNFANIASVNILKKIGIEVDAIDVDNLFTSVTQSTSPILFNKGETKSIFLEFSPKALELGKLDLGIFKFDDFKFDLKLRLKIDLKFNDDGSAVVLSDYNVESFGFEFSEDINKTIPLMLFDAEVKDGKFVFNIEFDGNHALSSNSKIEFTYNKLDLKCGKGSGATTLVSISNSTDAEKELNKFSYNFSSNEWNIPNDITSFSSLSGASLVNQIHIVINTMQTALRSLVEQKTKLDFLDGSIDTIVDIVDKIQTFVYGNDEVEGLLKCVNGSYAPNFDSLEILANKFNRAWKDIFNLKGMNEGERDVTNYFVKIIENGSPKDIIPFAIEFYDANGEKVSVSGSNASYCLLSFNLVFNPRFSKHVTI